MRITICTQDSILWITHKHGYPQYLLGIAPILFAMGRIDAVISDDLEKKLRIKAVQEFGGKKGSLTEALEAAIEAWTKVDAIESKEKKKHEH